MWRCHYCRSALSLEVQRKNRLCPNCGSDIHACKNCVHYDEELSSKCREPQSPWIRDRAAQNHCPFFEFLLTPESPDSSANAPSASNDPGSEAERAKEAFRALFRNP